MHTSSAVPVSWGWAGLRVSGRVIGSLRVCLVVLMLVCQWLQRDYVETLHETESLSLLGEQVSLPQVYLYFDSTTSPNYWTLLPTSQGVELVV